MKIITKYIIRFFFTAWNGKDWEEKPKKPDELKVLTRLKKTLDHFFLRREKLARYYKNIVS